MTTKKEAFIDDYIKQGKTEDGVTLMATVMKLPTGAKELISNYHQLNTKVEYIIENYNDDLELKHNHAVKIVAYLFA